MEMLEYIFEENLLPKSIFGKVSSYFFLLFIGVKLLYNVVLLSAVP